jgi:hypothetical protein
LTDDWSSWERWFANSWQDKDIKSFLLLVERLQFGMPAHEGPV